MSRAARGMAVRAGAVRNRIVALAAGAACLAAAIPATAAANPAPAPPPPLPVRAAALLEENTDQSLYDANASAELSIASTTKLMTALVTLHHASLADVFTDPGFSFPAEDSQIYLQAGERMTVRDLLTAMLLPSADDAAEVLAASQDASIVNIS